MQVQNVFKQKKINKQINKTFPLILLSKPNRNTIYLIPFNLNRNKNTKIFLFTFSFSLFSFIKDSFNAEI